MRRFIQIEPIIIISFIFLIACKDETNIEQDRIEIQTEAQIQDRINVPESDSIVEIGDGLKASPSGTKFKLYYRAGVKSPKIKNVSLRATHISMNGNYAFVSYNHEGDTYLGGLDVIDLSNPKKPNLISSAIFYDTDVSGLYFDPVSTKLYMATATEDESFEAPSVLEELVLNNNIPTTTSRRVSVPSYVATDVKTVDDKVFVTSGDAGGLSILLQTDLSEVQYFDIEDARAVEYTTDYIIVMQGSPARLRYYDRNDYSFLGAFTYDGANIAEAKSAFCVENDKVFIGGGDKGVIISDIFSNNVVETIPIPDVPGVDQDKIQSNSVTIEDGLIFIANGEAGVHVAEFDYTNNTATLLGRTQFGQKESANFVLVKDDWFFMARGKAGFRIVQVQYD